MHMRKKGVKKTDEKFSIDEGAIEVMDHYKYLGCSLTEHLEYKVMLEERAKAGSRAMAAWLSRCRMSVGEVKGETFIRLMEALVQSVLLYGAEVWGCGRKLGAVEQVQLRAARMFLGVSKLHPKVSLQFEMGMLPLELEAKKRCIEIWWRILRLDEDRLVRQVALEVLRTRGKVRWLKELEQSLEKFEWQNVRMEDLERMSLGEVKCMLTDSAVWVVKQEWEEEAKIRSKLQMMGRLMEYDCKARCVETGRKNLRRVLVKLRGGTAGLRVEIGRWNNLKREERICKQCEEEVEDEEHFLLHCGSLVEKRKELLQAMGDTVEGFQKMGEKKKCALILDRACKEGEVGRVLEKMWYRRFYEHSTDVTD